MAPTIYLQMVDFGKEAIDLEDEDAVDRIIQCSQAASPFFSVTKNQYAKLHIILMYLSFKLMKSIVMSKLLYSNTLEVPSMSITCVVVSFLCGRALQVQSKPKY